MKLKAIRVPYPRSEDVREGTARPYLHYVRPSSDLVAERRALAQIPRSAEKERRETILHRLGLNWTCDPECSEAQMLTDIRAVTQILLSVRCSENKIPVGFKNTSCDMKHCQTFVKHYAS
jgi:hypothetical protein